MLVINAVLTLLATISLRQNHHSVSLKIDSDAQYWELWINTHTAAPPDQNQQQQQSYQVQYTNR